jgi:hypothetical protein
MMRWVDVLDGCRCDQVQQGQIASLAQKTATAAHSGEDGRPCMWLKSFVPWWKPPDEGYVGFVITHD